MFITEHKPETGVAEDVAEGLQVVTAPNASPMTFTGTRSYILGDREVAIIDPGPNDPAHFAALQKAIAGRRVSHVLVTHSHVDHSPLAQAFEAPVLAFGPSGAGMSKVMQGLAQLEGGEGIDTDFRPDQLLADGDMVTGVGWAIEAVHTPGHMSNHLCFAYAGGLLSGDHVMAWSTTLVSPPDGDLTQFMASLNKLKARREVRYFPGHGPVLEDPQAMLDYQISHRLDREAQILAALPGGITAITAEVYQGLNSRLLPIAARNVFAHLIDLCQRGKVRCEGEIRFDGRYELGV